MVTVLLPKWSMASVGGAQWLKMQYFVSLEGQSLSLVSIPGI